MKIQTSKSELAKAFTAWAKRYQTNPKKFDLLALGKAKSYGDACASYLCSLLQK